MAQSFRSFSDFATFVTALAPQIRAAEHAAVKEGAELLEREAKKLIGTYEAGWPRLKPATIARKRSGDTPLLETGKLRDSIEHKVAGTRASIGSNLDYAVFQELGTSRVPPRPFLTTTAARHGKDAAEIARKKVIAAMLGRSGIVSGTKPEA